MVDFIKIEKDVEEKLNGVGLAKEGETWLAYRVLFHLFAADEMLHQMWKPQFDNVKEWYGRVFRTVFVKKLLRETKKPKKSHLPPIPPTMVKETKVKTEIRERYKKGAPLLSLDERKTAFREECHKHDERYGIDEVEDFFNHWSEETIDGIMRYEVERRDKSWNTAKRLYKWHNDPITKAKKIANIRLAETKSRTSKAKGTAAPSLQNTPQQDAVAKKRAADNDKLFAEINKAKEEHVSYAEYKRTNPESTPEMDLSQVRESIGRRLDKPG